MFLFHHRDQRDAQGSANYFKGKLFEELLREYLSVLGFEVELRQKHNSLEYDLDGRGIVDGRRLIGEAKAVGKPISGEIMSAFLGKLWVPFGQEGSRLSAVFLSTSSLTPEAHDHLRAIQQAVNFTVRGDLTGEGLATDLSAKLRLPDSKSVEAMVAAMGGYPLSRHLLITENGPHVLQISAAEKGATPANFTVFRRDGVVVSDSLYLDRLRADLPELTELSPLYNSATISDRRAPRANIPQGLILGRSWADYRLPAPPEFFVGRHALSERVLSRLLSADSPGVLQLKSRSGVGKSSFMALLTARLRNSSADPHLYDARDIKSVFDLWAVVQRFTGATKPPADFGEMEEQIAQRASQINNRAVLLIDQFESTFNDPALYDAYESLAMAVVRNRPSACLVLARKNDLLTTYDADRVSLNRLNSVSEAILLEDFTAQEAVELISAISRHAEKPVAKEVKAYVLEFAQGFPWLLKRTMAHVFTVLQRATEQEPLFPTTLHLGDLFDEELEELDELERDYLIRIAPHLPATFDQLHRLFDEDPRLRVALDGLTIKKLLRVSGSTYDTYNDVFKEYIVYKKLPEFRQSFVYKLTPASILPAFEEIVGLNRFTTAELGEKLGRARGTTFNLLRELRNLGLVDRSGDAWVITDGARDAFSRERLGEFVRQQLVRNALVSDLLVHVQSAGTIRLDALSVWLQKRLPFVAAAEKTWVAYAQLLLSWLGAVKLLEISGDVISSVGGGDRAEVVQQLGNLIRKGRGRAKAISFLPGSRWKAMEAALEKLSVGMRMEELKRDELEASRDLLELGLIDAAGKLTNVDPNSAKKTIARILHSEPYTSYWASVAAGAPPGDELKRRFGLGTLSEHTVMWRVKLLSSWSRAVGVQVTWARQTRSPKRTPDTAEQEQLSLVPPI